MATKPENVFAPPRTLVADPVSDEPIEKASRGARLGAKALDGLIIGVPLIPTYIAVFSYFINGRQVAGNFRSMLPYMLAGMLVVLAIAIYNWVLLYRNGQTIGKKLVEIKIVRTDGSRASLSRLVWLRGFVNSLIALVPFVGRFYGLIDLLFIFGDARRCLHDYIADTIVVKA